MAELKYGIAFKTQKSIAEVEDWMEANCAGDWDVQFGGLDESEPTRIRKIVEVYFETEADKQAFRAGFSRG